jgi:hypothetical protein
VSAESDLRRVEGLLRSSYLFTLVDLRASGGVYAGWLALTSGVCGERRHPRWSWGGLMNRREDTVSREAGAEAATSYKLLLLDSLGEQGLYS